MSLYETVVAIDLETTGPDPFTDQIIEIGAAVYRGGQVVDTFSELAAATATMAAPIIKLTGISPEMLEGKPPLQEVIARFMAFLPADALCIAHNATFERSFLGRATGQKFNHIVLDTVGLSRICFPELESHSLACLSDYLGFVPDTTHRALDDCRTLLNLWALLLERAEKIPPAVIGEINYLLASHQNHPFRDFFRRLEADALTRNFGHAGRIEDIFPAEEQKPPVQESISDKEDWVKLDRAKVEWVFQEGGFLEKSFENFEPRAGQVEMAGDVVEAFNNGRHLLVEAGTGTGKSLAYLIPAVIWARENGVPVVISTNTKNLQSQLFDKDIPFVKKALGIDFKAAIIKGRSNYLCVRKLLYLLRQAESELDAEERMQMVTILTWAAGTDTGDISENIVTGRPGFWALWAKLSTSGEDCLGRACRHYRRCFLRKARNRALSAQIVVANHSLVFAELNTKSPNLPEYAQIVFDEAHNLEDAATRHLSIEVSPQRLEIAAGRLLRSGRKGSLTGLIPSIIEKLTSANIPEDLRAQALRHAEHLPELLAAVDVPAQGFFGEIDILRKSANDASSLRFCPERRREQLWGPVDLARQNLCAALAEVMHTCGHLLADLKEAPEEAFEYQREFIRDLESVVSWLRELTEDMEFVLSAANPDYVYWIERAGNKPGNVRVVAAPTAVGALLHDQLYARKRSVIFSSATMSVRGSFDFLDKRLGIDLIDRARLCQKDVGSPFDYPKQTLVLVPSFLPEPGERGRDYTAELSLLMAEVFRCTRGRALGLFTSYDMLRRSYEMLHNELLGDGIEILAQGQSGSRKNITAVFKRDINSVLLGTHSFWEGVDVVGEALSCLVIARLPFAVFTDPIIEARCERVEAEGGNAFMGYSLPSAVIRFKQGFGRLIRHKNDRGVVIVADRRIVAKKYGRWFQDSLPCKTLVYNDRDKFIRDIVDFLGEQ